VTQPSAEAAAPRPRRLWIGAGLAALVLALVAIAAAVSGDAKGASGDEVGAGGPCAGEGDAGAAAATGPVASPPDAGLAAATGPVASPPDAAPAQLAAALYTSSSARDAGQRVAPVTLSLESRPSGATVLEGGERLGRTPLVVTSTPGSPERSFVLRRRGFRRRTVTWRPGTSERISVELAPVRSGGGREGDEERIPLDPNATVDPFKK